MHPCKEEVTIPSKLCYTRVGALENGLVAVPKEHPDFDENPCHGFGSYKALHKQTESQLPCDKVPSKYMFSTLPVIVTDHHIMSLL